MKDGGAVPAFLLKKPEFTEKDLEGKEEEEIEMMKLMGFGGFDTTKVIKSFICCFARDLNLNQSHSVK